MNIIKPSYNRIAKTLRKTHASAFSGSFVSIYKNIQTVSNTSEVTQYLHQRYPDPEKLVFECLDQSDNLRTYARDLIQKHAKKGGDFQGTSLLRVALKISKVQAFINSHHADKRAGIRELVARRADIPTLKVMAQTETSGAVLRVLFKRGGPDIKDVCFPKLITPTASITSCQCVMNHAIDPEHIKKAERRYAKAKLKR